MLFDIHQELDLHGFDRYLAVLTVKDFITDMLKMHEKRFIIIHGIGQDILSKAVHQYLAKDRRVLSYKLDFMNPGCTIVELK